MNALAVAASVPIRVFIDFETRSEIDIKKVGSWLYAEHPTTSPLCVVYTVENEEPVLLPYEYWQYEDCRYWRQAKRLAEMAADPNYIFVAHNSVFEQAIWQCQLVDQWGYPSIPIERWKCTMAKTYTHALPGKLEEACEAMQLPVQKDMEGNKIMLKLSKPRRKDGFPWWTPDEVPEDFQKLYSYCTTDTLASREIDNALRDINPKETLIWQIDQRMNNTGVPLDLVAIRKAIEFGGTCKARLKQNFWFNTDVESPQQSAKFLLWMQKRGLNVLDTKAPTIATLLKRPDLDPDVRAALICSQGIKKTSLAKYPQMLARSTEFGILRENLNYHKAHTGRYGGRGVQIQNLPRPTTDSTVAAETIINCSYEQFEWIYGDDPMGALSSAIRAMIVAPEDHDFFVADLAQMEARVLAWLAGQQDVLDLFAAGEDLYCLAAAKIFGYKVDKSMKMERQVGKIAVLALGYGGGIGAFAKFAKQYDIDLMPVYAGLWKSSTAQERINAEKAYILYLKRTKREEAVTREVAFVCDIIKQRWRFGNAQIEQYWHVLENAACQAVVTGQPQQAGRLTFFMHGIFLYCMLPSGKYICYPYPKTRQKRNNNYELSYYSTEHGRETTYGGKIAENVTQAVQRELLVDAILRLEAVYPVIFHVHDELVSPVRRGFGSIEEYKQIVMMVPKWADGIPIDATAWSGPRYGKD